MTPPDAMTPAARRAGGAKRTARGATQPEHGRGVRPGVGPRTPRRVSGPATGRVVQPPVRAEAMPLVAPLTTPRTRPLGPRVSPAPPRAKPRRASRRAARLGRARVAQPRGPLGARLLLGLRTLPDHRVLDRLVRGGAWIPVLGMMLAGIVAMQVEVLKLGANMGRNLQLSTALQSRNELLRASVASLSDDQRIESMAARMGMVMPGPTQIKFLSGASADATRALRTVRRPDPAGFVSALAGQGQLAGQRTSGPSAG